MGCSYDLVEKGFCSHSDWLLLLLLDFFVDGRPASAAIGVFSIGREE